MTIIKAKMGWDKTDEVQNFCQNYLRYRDPNQFITYKIATVLKVILIKSL